LPDEVLRYVFKSIFVFVTVIFPLEDFAFRMLVVRSFKLISPEFVSKLILVETAPLSNFILPLATLISNDSKFKSLIVILPV